MADSFSSGKILGTVLMIVGLALGVVAVAWLAANAATGSLQPGGFVLGLFFMMLFILPLLLAGIVLRRRGAADVVAEAVFDEQRKLFERDHLFRQTLQQESRRAAGLLDARVSEAQGETSEMLRQARRTLEGLAEEASQPLAEADWLHSISLDPHGVRDVERFGDLLLAGVRRIRQTAGREGVLETSTARDLSELARSIQRQYAIRQDLVVRGRKLPSVSPLHLLKAELPEREQITLESIEPGGAMSHEDRDYLVTAHATYFSEGQSLHALVLRGEEGVRLLLVNPVDDRVLFMEPAETSQLPESVEKRGTASVSVDSLSGRAEGVVVDYRLTVGPHGRLGWWERWPEGEKAYTGHEIRSSEFQLWPSAVGSQ